MRYSGKEHVGPSGKLHQAKHVGQACNDTCKLQCCKNFDEESRKKIFDVFWGYEDKVAQRLFLARHVIPTPAKRHLTGSKKKEKMMMYHFYSESKKVQVCRLFFLQTLDIKKM